MRVCIDVSAAVHRRAGLGRYAQELTAALVEQAAHDYLAFYHQRGAAHLVPPIDRLPRLTTALNVRPWRLRTALAYFTGVGMDALFPGVDVFHATEHLLPRLRRIRSVFTLHDLIFQFDPGSHKPLNLAFLKTLVPRFLRAANAIITVSECTKRDAIRLYRVPPDKIRVIYEGVDPRFKPIDEAARLDAVRYRYGLPDRFILHVGTLEPRKNLPLLFEALPALATVHGPLVIAGQKGWLYEPIFARVRELGLQKRVVFTGYVSDEDLPALLSAASVLVMPSKYEGFGLPVLEAMACGTPVIASNTSSLPEVGGAAALYAPPDDPRQWVEALTQVLNDVGLRMGLREKGLRQAAKFRWHVAARQTAKVYSAVAQV
ncbi:MAG TPA: glycosyltransferase family 1 protein [Anaerolineae bacterium]|nr:glycosyltransferase family 1 protein [Anaerolineae bacterium]